MVLPGHSNNWTLFLLFLLLSFFFSSTAADTSSPATAAAPFATVISTLQQQTSVSKNYVITWGINFVGELGGVNVNAPLITDTVAGLDSILINGKRIIQIKSNFALTNSGELIAFGFINWRTGIINATLLSNMPFKVTSMAEVAEDETENRHFNDLMVVSDSGDVYTCPIRYIALPDSGGVTCDFTLMPTFDQRQPGVRVKVKKVYERWRSMTAVLAVNGDLFLRRGGELYNVTSGYNLTDDLIDIYTTGDQAFLHLTHNRIVACGNNKQGKLARGKPEFLTELVPVDVSSFLKGSDSISQISTGREHVMVLLSNNLLLTFGSNSYDQLLRRSGTSYTPDVIEYDFPPTPKLKIIAEEYASVLITSSGYDIPQIHVWGMNENDLFKTGEFYYKSPTRADKFLAMLAVPFDEYYSFDKGVLLHRGGTQITYWLSPVTTPVYEDARPLEVTEPSVGFAISKQTRVFHGSRATFFLLNGDALAIGSNIYGRLGVGDTAIYKTSLTPVKLSTIPTKDDAPVKIADITIDEYITMFLLEDGRIAAAGSNLFYQFTQRDRAMFKETPTLISALELIPIRQIVSSEMTSMALERHTKKLHLWGFSVTTSEELSTIIDIDKYIDPDDDIKTMHAGTFPWLITQKGRLLFVRPDSEQQLQDMGATDVSAASGDSESILVMKMKNEFYASGINFFLTNDAVHFKSPQLLSHLPDYRNTSFPNIPRNVGLKDVRSYGYMVLFLFDNNDIYRCGIESYDMLSMTYTDVLEQIKHTCEKRVDGSYPYFGFLLQPVWTLLPIDYYFGSFVVVEVNSHTMNAVLLIAVSFAGIMLAAVSCAVTITAVILCARWINRIRSRRENAGMFEKLIDDYGLELSEAWRIQYLDITELTEIGSGASATVYKGKWRGRDVAVKMFPTHILGGAEESDLQQFHTELKTLTIVRDKNIIHFYGATFSRNCIGLVTDYCKNGTLKQYIMRHKGSVTWPQKLRFAMEIANGLLYLHSLNLIHRDLKPENVLIDDDCHAKLTDFGLTKVMKTAAQPTTLKIGTNVYVAPEMTLGTPYDERCDVFSFAIIMHELLTENFNPYSFAAQSNFNIESVVAHDPTFRPKIPEKQWSTAEAAYIELMKKCWAHDFHQRPSMTTVYSTLQDVNTMTAEDG